MRRKLCLLMYFFIASILLLSCSNYSSSANPNDIIKSSSDNNSTSILENSDVENFTINVWSYNFNPDSIIEKFNILFPKAKINVVFLDSMDYVKVINALASNNSPDIIIYSLDYIGQFNSINGFEDLYQSDYNFSDVKEQYNSADLKQCHSFDGTKLIGVPFTQGTTVTYYRSDIFESLDLPTEPEDVAELMSTAEGWLSMAHKLKENNTYALQWKDDFVKMFLNSYGVFDENMELTIYNEKLKDALLICSEVYSEGLISKTDLWSDQGKKSLRDGEVAMVYMNKWAEDYLNSTAPETAGLWRATNLPLGLYSSQNTNIASVSSSSKYKSQCWEFIKFLTTDESQYYNSRLDEQSEFLGGQEAQALFHELGENLPFKFHTQLDDTVYTLILEYVNSITERIQDINASLMYLESKIMTSVGYEHQILSEE